MARIPSSTIRRSYDEFRANADDEAESLYTCDCGQDYMTQDTLRRHQQTNCPSRSLTCSFCQEICSTTVELRDHLLQCGNKTDQCPNCHKLIRRSHFAYHYENNCAPVDEVETPPPRPKNRSALHLPTNSNQPVSREDVPGDDFPGQHSSIYSPRANGRLQSPVSTPRSSPGVTECEYCHNQCTQNDYKTHRDNCLRNPTNANYKPSQSRISLGTNQNQNNANGVVHIPCEICNQPIDVPNWSMHIQSCREREAQRIAMRARSISQEPVTEQLPCEYCEQLYSAKQIQAHQTKCPNNPENVESATRIARPRPPQSTSLPTRSKNPGSRPASSNDLSRGHDRNVHYQLIDRDRTRAANRSDDNDRLIDSRNSNRIPVRLANDDMALPSDYPQGIRTYDNEPRRSSGHRSHENISRSNRSKSTDRIRLHERQSLDNLRNIEDIEDPNGGAAGNRSPYYQDARGSRRNRSENGTLEVIDNHPDRPFTKRHKDPWWKELFGCGSNSHRYDN